VSVRTLADMQMLVNVNVYAFFHRQHRHTVMLPWTAHEYVQSKTVLMRKTVTGYTELQGSILCSQLKADIEMSNFTLSSLSSRDVIVDSM